METATRKDSIDIAKGIAMICVISAHCNTILDSATKIASMQSLLLKNYSTAGVILLFMISGYLFHADKGGKGYLLKKIRIIIPAWIVSGVIVYLYVHLRKPPVSLVDMIGFILGSGSYLYYLTVLFAFYLLFSIPFMRNQIVLIICILAGFVHTIFFPSSIPVSFLNQNLNALK